MKFLKKYLLINLLIFLIFILTSCYNPLLLLTGKNFSEICSRPMFNEYVVYNTDIHKDLTITGEFEDVEKERIPVIGAKLIFDLLEEPEKGYTSLVNSHKVKLILVLENDEQIVLDSIGDGGSYSPPDRFSYRFTSRDNKYDNKWYISCSLYYLPYNSSKDKSREEDYIYFNSDLTVFEDFVQLIEASFTFSYDNGANSLYETITMMMCPLEYSRQLIDIQEGLYKSLDGENNYFINQKTLNVPNQKVIEDFDYFEFNIDKQINYAKSTEKHITNMSQTIYTINALVESSKLNQSHSFECFNVELYDIAKNGKTYRLGQRFNFPTSSNKFGLFTSSSDVFDQRVYVIVYSIQDDLVLNGVTYEKHQGLLVRLMTKTNFKNCMERYFTMYLDDFE